MLKKPVVTEVRTPTNTWSGLGFSKSMPAETIKELRRANHVSYKPSMSTTYEVRQKWKCFNFHYRDQYVQYLSMYWCCVYYKKHYLPDCCFSRQTFVFCIGMYRIQSELVSFWSSGFPTVVVSIQQPGRRGEREWLWQLAWEERHQQRPSKPHRVRLSHQQSKEETEQIWSVNFCCFCLQIMMLINNEMKENKIKI